MSIYLVRPKLVGNGPIKSTATWWFFPVEVIIWQPQQMNEGYIYIFDMNHKWQMVSHILFNETFLNDVEALPCTTM